MNNSAADGAPDIAKNLFHAGLGVMGMQDADVIVSKYFARLTGRPGLDESVNVFEAGLVNSLAVIQMISFLEKEFRIRVELDDLERENFSSIRAVTQFLNGKRPASA